MIKIPQYFQLKNFPLLWGLEPPFKVDQPINNMTQQLRMNPDFQTSEAWMSWYYKLQMVAFCLFHDKYVQDFFSLKRSTKIGNTSNFPKSFTSHCLGSDGNVEK